MSDRETADEPSEATGPLGRFALALRTARSLALANPRASVVAAIALVAIIVSTSVLCLVVAPAAPPAPKSTRPAISLDDALAALDDHDYKRARKLAESLRRSSPAGQAGGALFVLGAAAAYEAEEFLGRERRELFLLAANYLGDAAQQEMPPDRRGSGLWLLGKSLNMSGKYAESRGPLEASLPLNPAEESSLHLLLATAYSKGEKRDLQKAQGHIVAYLNDESLDSSTRQTGLLEQLRILYQTGDEAACETVMAEIPRESTVYADAELIHGRMVMRAAGRLNRALHEDSTAEQKAHVKQAYENAVRILRRAQGDPLGSQNIRRSMYLIGVCFLEIQDYPAALAQFERTRKVWLNTEEGLAAALQEAELLRRATRVDEAMAAYHRVLAAVKAPLANAWIPSDEFRRRVLDTYRELISDNQFEKAVALAENLVPLFPPARAAEYAAEAMQTWSKKLLLEADKLNESEAVAARAQSRALMRKAGRLFAQTAKLEFTTRQYPEDLWRSGEALLQGHDFRGAAATFEEYLKHELRRLRPRALMNLGECYLALNRLNDALAVGQECVEFYPSDAASYQARLLTSKVYTEKGDTAKAEAALRENLNGELLAPESKEWRESLFRLGELLQADGRYEEAIQRLREAVERYPETHEAVRARYLIAESYRQLAKGIQEKRLKDTIETTRLAHQKEEQSRLNAAIQYYKQVQDSLNQQHQRTRLTTLEKAILRNSYFAEGAAWFDLGRYDNAIGAYSTIINRYQHDPEALEAFVQIATCYRRSNRPIEARGTIQQAKVVLNRMNANTSFNEVTSNSRREWLDLLNWLATL